MSKPHSNDEHDATTPVPKTPVPAEAGRLAAVDQWMAVHPAHPRIAPFLAYIVLLPVVSFGTDYLPLSYPVLYTIQCVLVGAMLWRYRKLTPELTLSFHWLAVIVGVGVFVTWIVLGMMMVRLWPAMFEMTDVKIFWDEAYMGPIVGHIGFSLRLVGMAILVPLFEELFIRSLALRCLHRRRETEIGILQILEDLPLIGEWVLHTNIARRAAHQPAIFSTEFKRTPLGALSMFGVAASTFVFMLSHNPRDWPGIWACGIAYCLLLGFTRHKGLGPVIWAHGITNALLWVYTLQTGDWQFL